MFIEAIPITKYTHAARIRIGNVKLRKKAARAYPACFLLLDF